MTLANRLVKGLRSHGDLVWAVGRIVVAERRKVSAARLRADIRGARLLLWITGVGSRHGLGPAGRGVRRLCADFLDGALTRID